MSDNVLLRVNLFPHTHAPYLKEQELEGTVICRDRRYYLDVEASDASGPVELELHFPEKQEPLYRFFADQTYRVRMEGQRREDWMNVTSLSDATREIMRFRITPELVEWLIQCLEGTLDPRNRYLLRRSDEADIWLKVMGDRVPVWVRQAVRKNIMLQKGGGNSDSRNHALQALNYLCSIDWTPEKPRVPTVRQAERILDQEFFGMKEAKTRILEMVAQMNRTGKMPKWGLLLNGPAGVGKSSILKAVSRILGMPVIQLDISSIGKDVEAISGSSRIFSNAYGGKILSGMYLNGTCQAIVVINELDKCNRSEGRVSDVLLTLIDRLGFYENFLEECIPTDHLFFVASSNEIDQISEPMRNRFLTVHLPGYSEEEKMEIFRRFVMPGAMRNMNISPRELAVDERAVKILVQEYATESGVRDLEQYAQTIAGDYARRAELEDFQTRQVYGEEELRRLFGPGRRIVNVNISHPGRAMGAYCQDGKARLFDVQASLTAGSGDLRILGPLTDVQKDYAMAAYECVRSTSGFDLERVDVTLFARYPIEESAGNAMGMAVFAAICSLLCGRTMDLGKILFLGGCDLHGNLYAEQCELLPILKMMKDRDMTTLYAPLGTGQIIQQLRDYEGGILVVEALDAKTLFTLASARGMRAGGGGAA